MLIMDEPTRIRETARQMEREEAEWQTALLGQGEYLPELKVSFSYEELFQRIPLDVIYLSLFMRQTPGIQPQNIVQILCRGMQQFHGQMHALKTEWERWIKGRYRVIFAAGTEERAERLIRVLADYGMEVTKDTSKNPPAPGHPVVRIGTLLGGFEMSATRLAVITEGEVFTQRRRRARRIAKMDYAEKIKDYQDLKPGDYVVHVNHGIGRYAGIETLEVDGRHKDYLLIQYAGNDKLYVPVEQIEQVQKYIGSEEKKPKVYSLGGSEWSKVKNRVRSSVQDIAAELIQLYAKRQAAKGYAFSKDTPFQREFDAMFPYEETPDQLRSIEEIKRDMERDRPMDRLLCGDVGYGKTEVAIRAAFKAVMDGKQVAVLVPTTILAQQHYETFRERFADFPVEIRVLSRFRTRKEQQGNDQGAQGSHRGHCDRHPPPPVQGCPVSGSGASDHRRGTAVRRETQGKDQADEAQRGCADPHRHADSPHPPHGDDRRAGSVRHRDAAGKPLSGPNLCAGVLRRPGAGGDRAGAGPRGAGLLPVQPGAQHRPDGRSGAALVPEARVAVAHGQMPETELEKVMLDFLDGEYDVLVSTTIIETGVDIPNVNTLIIYDADKMGLSQLYQLRGRVGRSNRIAYAYFTYQRDKVLSEAAEKRLQAIKEFTELGSGFKIAMRDLAIRGAGNLLGAEQHGHIASVGFELYSQMLKEAIEELQGKEEKEKSVEPEIELKVDAYLPAEYIRDEKQKIEIYKKIRSVRTLEEARDLEEEIEDRFGDLPEPVINLLRVARIRAYAVQYGIEQVVQEKGEIVIRFSPDQNGRIDAGRLIRLTHEVPDRRVRLSSGRRVGIAFKVQGMSSGDALSMIERFLEKFETVLKKKGEMRHAAQ